MTLENLEEIDISSTEDNFYEAMEKCKNNFEDLDGYPTHEHTAATNTAAMQEQFKKQFAL